MNSHISQALPRKNAFSAAVRLRCPRCEHGKLFYGWFQMNKQCGHCGLSFEREPGFYLGSIYINYGATVVLAGAGYAILYFHYGISKEVGLSACVTFAVLFPLWFFRYARSLFLATDFNINPELAHKPVGLESPRTDLAMRSLEDTGSIGNQKAGLLIRDHAAPISIARVANPVFDLSDDELAAMHTDDAAAGRAIGVIVSLAFLFGFTLIGTAVYASYSINR